MDILVAVIVLQWCDKIKWLKNAIYCFFSLQFTNFLVGANTIVFLSFFCCFAHSSYCSLHSGASCFFFFLNHELVKRKCRVRLATNLSFKRQKTIFVSHFHIIFVAMFSSLTGTCTAFLYWFFEFSALVFSSKPPNALSTITKFVQCIDCLCMLTST